jgi:3-dehydroquinate synthase
MSSEIIYQTMDELYLEIKKTDTDQIPIVVDHAVWSKYSHLFNFKERIPEKQFIIWKASSGEQCKSFEEFEKCCEFFLNAGIHRNAHLYAIGGGATSDFGGFVASTLLRGIPWSIIPTTLLSIIDASIGGKVAINSKLGKNLIGAFYPPEKILINFNFLETLSPLEMASGMGELLKYGLLDANINKLIKEQSDIQTISKACAEYKAKITGEDLREHGDRVFLNLGHSFGHGIEKIYDIPHGIAVVWGMQVIGVLFDQPVILQELASMIHALQLEIVSPPWLNKTFPQLELIEFMNKDKKKQNKDQIQLVGIKEVGSPTIIPINIRELGGIIQEKAKLLKTFSFK